VIIEVEDKKFTPEWCIFVTIFVLCRIVDVRPTFLRLFFMLWLKWKRTHSPLNGA